MARATTVVRRRARIERLAVILATVSALVLGGTVAAHANPTAAQLEAQIDQQWNQVEPIIEKADLLDQQIHATQAKVSDLQAKIAPLALQIDLVMTKVSVFSRQMYIDGPGSKLNALISNGSPTTFIDQLTEMNSLSRDQTRSIADVMALKAQYDQQKKPLDALLVTMHEQQATLDSEAKVINSAIAQLDVLRVAAYGPPTGNVQVLHHSACPAVYDGSPGARAAKFACAQIGKRYVWDTAGPNTYDCSGLTMAAWASVGIDLPHNAYEQRQNTTRISASQLQVGDLIFYYSTVHHVTIYVGGGWVVSAPTYGEPVQMQSITYNPNIVGYGRPHS